MGLAEDKVYIHITGNLKKFAAIRVASLADSLTCLVDSDRDELLAREETRGNQAAVFRFYQHLRCRKGWVQDLIQALHHNNAGHLADELQEVYDTWQPRPRSSAPVADSSLPSDAHPSPSSISAQTPPRGPNPAPLAGQPRRDRATGDHPPVLPSAGTTTSTELEARLPVQESLPKKLPEQESPRPVPPGSKVHGGGSGGHSGEGNLSHPAGAVPVTAATPGVAVSPEQGRDWLSRRPVCVDNGFFGNANHLHRGTPGLALGRAAPSRDAGATHSPGQPRNEPEESSDISTESPPRLEGATRVEQQPPKSVPKKQPVPSSGQGEATGSFVDVRSPLLIQEQFDVEKKRVGMLPEHPESGAASMETATLGATPVPRATFPSRDSSVKSLMQEKKLPIGNTASSTPSVPAKEKVLPASANPVLGTAVVGGSEGVAGRSASRVSSATSIWAPQSDEEREEELSKPGVLVSTPQGSPEVASRYPSPQEPSNCHSTPSSSLGLSSDPILVSSDSLSSGAALPRVSSVPAGPREKEAPGASRDSCPAPGWDSSSLGTHELRVDHHPSVQLGAGTDGVTTHGSSVNSSSGSATSSPRARAPKGDSNGLSLLYILPAVGVISAVAFAVYARLRK
ncbi:mitochondrial antiviral-signaling protein [Agelaius tricolor]|uniref:mitochondrial antiviral-signaling protein n=1 Tax=Agelaius tricolor TaxID=9191 RepID=UPI0039F20AFE